MCGIGENPMKLNVMLLAFAVLISGQASGRDEFESVRCGGDIPRSLIGKHSPNEQVDVTEARHRDLALENVGGDIITDEISMIDWSICGAEYYLLVDQDDIIRDVLPFPNHSRAAPATASRECQRDGLEMKEMVYAVLDNKAGYNIKMFDHKNKTPLRVLWAWEVDEKKRKFVKLVGDMACPVSDVDVRDRVP
jgi:hypothetical protein